MYLSSFFDLKTGVFHGPRPKKACFCLLGMVFGDFDIWGGSFTSLRGDFWRFCRFGLKTRPKSGGFWHFWLSGPDFWWSGGWILRFGSDIFVWDVFWHQAVRFSSPEVFLSTTKRAWSDKNSRPAVENVEKLPFLDHQKWSKIGIFFTFGWPKSRKSTLFLP